MDKLVDLLKSRGIETVCYFHTDHFEPWSYDISDESARAVDRMAAMARTSPYARKMSLFYSVFVPYRLATGESLGNDPRVPGDRITFSAYRSAHQEKLAHEVIRPLVASDNHEMHLHVHHEFWTRNTSHFDTPVSRWVNAHSTPDADKARLDLHFHLCKEVIARETDMPFDRWAFIHGNWALNASDPLICHIDNEMAMIMEHGGFGDFTFPAGRSYCDPKMETPFTCLPIELTRAYDDPRADPRPVGLGTSAMQEGRFFIWNSPIKSNFCSLDYYAASNRDLFKTPERIVERWLSKCVAIDGCLFVKTHAHSMKTEYKLTESDSVIPHCFPDVVATLDCLTRVCDEARVEFRSVTVNEVMAQLHRLDGQDTASKETAMSNAERYQPGAAESFKDAMTKSFTPVRVADRRGPNEIWHFAPRPAEAFPTSERVLSPQTPKPALDPQPSEQSLPPHTTLRPPYTADGGAAWHIPLPATFHDSTDTDVSPARSPLRLFENGALLGPGHALHDRIRTAGGGLYSFWKSGLWFSTSDGSNPNSNGRVYDIQLVDADANATTSASDDGAR